MDTVITMELYGRDSEHALQLAEEEINRLEKLLSIRGSDSEIAALNRSGSAAVSEDTAALLRTALSLSAQTGGAYDCTIEPIASCWGWYDGTPSLPAQETLKALLPLVSYDLVHLEDRNVSFETAGMGIDLGGIAKGYAAGQLAKRLKDAGITSGWLSLGGNVRAIGCKPDGSLWSIGIADPDTPSSYLCTVQVEDAAVVTSGDYQRCFVEDGIRWHHILDPETGLSVQNGLRSVTIVSSDDTLADGLSTALFVMGLDAASNFWRQSSMNFEVVFLTDAGIYVTDGLSGCFSCQKDYEVISR